MTARLQVRELSKCYSRWSSEWLRVLSWFGLRTRPAEEHWVLRDISFSVGPGECVGIVGQNGAGKSTLLKLITGTSRPTTGGVTRSGSIAAILELGMGFNPDLTGRQNVFHAAGLMGFGQAQIEGAIADIEAFAEIGEYFNEPVRTYSSGMQMRVAFSVATAFRPDLLIVDEALSVGDAYFVHKCFDRIREFREQGTSLLFVSHDPTAVQALCDRAILIESGRLILDAAPQQVIDYYNALIAKKEQAVISLSKRDDGAVLVESGSYEASLESVNLLNASGEATEYVEVGDQVTLNVRVRAHSALDQLIFGYMIRDRLGQPMFGTNTYHTHQRLSAVAEGQELVFQARFVAALGPGSYSISVSLTDSQDHLSRNYQWKDMALMFTVVNASRDYFIGSSWLPPEISIGLVADERRGAETNP
ncbi:ABC transporter ATP-binding protein [Lysobacter capsici]|uniref:ABC transporter ATP-binding protein n=1 Tax=Lysobacter capsici TaxID=435897 RepID=UPI001C001A8F|nr:ABC transporter ATP-binding protein [Lysobacter capsici]QWF16151.1 ABC transporter ATP-binding protein [Lysobacter capsici]